MLNDVVMKLQPRRLYVLEESEAQTYGVWQSHNRMSLPLSPAPDPQRSFARLVYPLEYYHSPSIVTLLFCAVSCVFKKQGKLGMEFVKERPSTYVSGL